MENFTLKEPDVNIMIIQNAYINNNKIYIKNADNLFLPTMYQSWTMPQQTYVEFINDDNNTIPDDNNTIQDDTILYIFDTWGISSYYHLLIDHIIPLWITKNMIETKLNIDDTKIKSVFYRVSNNHYDPALLNNNDIFKHFLKNNYVDNISGKFKYIIYGYAFPYRPYHGIYREEKYFYNYELMLDKFLNNVCDKNLISQEKCILIPKRIGRNNDIMNSVYNKLNNFFRVKYIDFAEYSIEEQIKMCSSAFAMIGMAGAAFANQVFIPKKSCMICICNIGDIDHLKFQSTLSKYLKHDFNTIVIDNEMRNEDIINNVINIIHTYIRNTN